jgi:Retrotransposon gag protein
MTTITAMREVKIRAPSDFTRDRTKTKKFLQEIELYIRANPDTYSDDKKKCILALSFMTGGTAAAWAQNHVDQNTNLGTWVDLKAAITKAFSPIDDAGTARTELKELRQGQGDLEDYITQFNILKGRCGITNDTALIKYFMDGLHPELLKKVFGKDNVPDTLNRWIEAASKFDGQWRRAKAIAGKAKTEKKMTPTPPPKTRETNTLDINRLSNQERAEHMRKGLCFVCHQQGHRSSDHKNRNIPTPSFSPNRNEN